MSSFDTNLQVEDVQEFRDWLDAQHQFNLDQAVEESVLSTIQGSLNEIATIATNLDDRFAEIKKKITELRELVRSA